MLAAQGQGMHGHQDISWIPSLWSVVGDLYYLYGEHSKWSGISSDQAVTCFDVFMAICGPTGLLHFGEKIIFLLWWNCFALWFCFGFWYVSVWWHLHCLHHWSCIQNRATEPKYSFFWIPYQRKVGSQNYRYMSTSKIFLPLWKNVIWHDCKTQSSAPRGLMSVWGERGLFCRLGWGVPYPPRPRAPTGRRDRGVTKSSIPEPPSLPTSSLSPNF